MANEKLATFSKNEYDSLVIFVEEFRKVIPLEAYHSIKKLLSLYNILLENYTKSKSMLKRLQEAMGISPKSEKGKNALGKILEMVRTI